MFNTLVGQFVLIWLKQAQAHRVIKRIVSSARPQYRSVAHLTLRDVPLQIGSILLLCGLCWYVEFKIVAVVVFVSVLLCELCLHMILRRQSLFRLIETDRAILFAMILCALNTVLYLLPALFLVRDPSLAMKITGMMWIMGVQVYLANTWSRVPTFLCVMVVPAMAMMVIAFFILRHAAPVMSSMTEWGIAAGFLALFLYSTIDTLRQHLSMEADLAKAQQESAQRLAKLEESDRLDALTGSLNRRAFDVALGVMLEDRKLTGGEITVFLVDLYSFKPINDTYSHEAGDEVLIQTADRLRAIIAQSGIVGRLGGDEFVCALHDLENAEDDMACGARLADAIAKPIKWNDRTLKIAVSIGVASSRDAANPTVSTLCSAADQVMFAAKSSPSGGPILYEAHLFAPRMTPEDKQLLAESIANRSVRPFYQPKVHLPTGRIIGFEALARWDHSTGHVRQPADFLDQINELGLQGDFMMSLAQKVVDDINMMLSQGLDLGQVSLNVSEVALATYSGRQDLFKIMQNNPDAARHLTFEITKDVFIARAADTIQASIASFRGLGVRISLDDFGTGFAPFHHLRQLDFDELKIDTSFVAGLGHDPAAEVLVRGFLNIASGLGVSVVAEGVETDAQSRDLINMGCLTAQGFLFSHAVPAKDACDLLKAQNDALAAL